MFLLYKYKPVCSIHNITYWLIKTRNDQTWFYLISNINYIVKYLASIILRLSVSDEGYPRNKSCALN
jgi:hypothetical protein